MIEKCFVDTNIWIYARDQKNVKKQERARDLIINLSKEHSLVISIQVVTEFCAAMVTKLKVPEELVMKDVARLMKLAPISLDSVVIDTGIKIREQYRLSFWDSWIVGAALVAGCKKLYSEDLPVGANYHGVLVVNPFAAS